MFRRRQGGTIITVLPPPPENPLTSQDPYPKTQVGEGGNHEDGGHKGNRVEPTLTTHAQKVNTKEFRKMVRRPSQQFRWRTIEDSHRERHRRPSSTRHHLGWAARRPRWTRNVASVRVRGQGTICHGATVQVENQ